MERSCVSDVVVLRGRFSNINYVRQIDGCNGYLDGEKESYRKERNKRTKAARCRDDEK